MVVGRIVKLEKHPDADKLQICQIDVGDQEPLQIVTGADNVFEGALVPVALCGSELPNGMKIKKGKLRGVESYGMLCSRRGALPEGKRLSRRGGLWHPDSCRGTGRRARTCARCIMMDDTVIEFEVGANRPDCLSVSGHRTGSGGGPGGAA